MAGFVVKLAPLASLAAGLGILVVVALVYGARPKLLPCPTGAPEPTASDQTAVVEGLLASKQWGREALLVQVHIFDLSELRLGEKSGREFLDRAVAAEAPTYHWCYTAEPRRHGCMWFRFTVLPSGSITDVQLVAGDEDASVSSCTRWWISQTRVAVSAAAEPERIEYRVDAHPSIG